MAQRPAARQTPGARRGACAAASAARRRALISCGQWSRVSNAADCGPEWSAALGPAPQRGKPERGPTPPSARAYLGSRAYLQDLAPPAAAAAARRRREPPLRRPHASAALENERRLQPGRRVAWRPAGASASDGAGGAGGEDDTAAAAAAHQRLRIQQLKRVFYGHSNGKGTPSRTRLMLQKAKRATSGVGTCTRHAECLSRGSLHSRTCSYTWLAACCMSRAKEWIGWGMQREGLTHAAVPAEEAGNAVGRAIALEFG
eukprot:12169-Chlamydomonas_euryale.AAC.4